MSFIFRIMPPKQPPVEYQLDLDLIRIGRSESNDIVISVPQVSSLHLELKREGESYRLKDCQSTNGTKVNGKRVEDTILENGDELLIGNEVAALFSISQSQVAATPVEEEAATPVAKLATPAPESAKPRPALAVPTSAPRKPAAPAVAKPTQVAAVARPAAPTIAKPAAPAVAKPVQVSAVANGKPATPSPGSSAPTVVIKRSPGASVPPARPPIKIAKPMPPAARKAVE
ncbi:MAG: FHA domain-containing protein [Verrucomicrobiae bacterium]|nr:FHA domain-containing protein [Verrucomicrobiae bacterium]